MTCFIASQKIRKRTARQRLPDDGFFWLSGAANYRRYTPVPHLCCCFCFSFSKSGLCYEDSQVPSLNLGKFSLFIHFNDYSLRRIFCGVTFYLRAQQINNSKASWGSLALGILQQNNNTEVTLEHSYILATGSPGPSTRHRS